MTPEKMRVLLDSVDELIVLEEKKLKTLREYKVALEKELRKQNDVPRTPA